MPLTPEEIKLRAREFAARLAEQRRERLAQDSAKRKYKDEKALHSLDNQTRRAASAKLNVRIDTTGRDAVLEAQRLRRLQDETLWRPAGIRLVGQWQECRTCGSTALATTGLFELQNHSIEATCHRLRAINLERYNFLLDLGFTPTHDLEGILLPVCVKCTSPGVVDDLLHHLTTHNHHFTNQLSLELQ